MHNKYLCSNEYIFAYCRRECGSQSVGRGGRTNEPVQDAGQQYFPARAAEARGHGVQLHHAAAAYRLHLPLTIGPGKLQHTFYFYGRHNVCFTIQLNLSKKIFGFSLQIRMQFLKYDQNLPI